MCATICETARGHCIVTTMGMNRSLLPWMLVTAALGFAPPAAARRTPTRHPRSGLQRAAALVPEPTSPAAEPLDAPADSAVTTFEALIQTATPLVDLQTLLISPTGGCNDIVSSIDRARCEASRAFLRRTLPQRTLASFGGDPGVLRVSEFDADIKGYHVSVSGCLACARPLPAGNQNDPFYVTLKVPARGDSLRDAVEINRSTASFENEAEARAWWTQTEGNLRVQFVFQPTLAEWTHSFGHGYAMKLLGFRVFNRCTREILVSRPPSSGIVDSALTDGCLQNPPAAHAEVARPVDEPKSALSAQDLSGAMSAIRPQVFACFDRFKVPGRAIFDYTVLGNGSVQSVRLDGVFAGTPSASCLLEAARSARFPHFAGVQQRFSYPFFLRAQ
jgi:hypothetical protein